ncbi:MAG: hypothetical protein RL623_853 [Actinomycetota bacterium]
MRRHPTAIDGKNNAADTSESKLLYPDTADDTITVNNVHHQNSLREARPLKVA